MACYTAPMDPASAEAQILAALRQLTGSRAREARLVLEAGPVYLLSIAREGRGPIEQEAVASAALPVEHKLSSERGQLLRQLGFGKRGGRRNWKRRHGRDSGSLERIARETADILTRVYAVDAPRRIELTEDESQHPENPALMAAMREVAKGFDTGTRRAMYSELLNATFLVPLDPELDDGGDDGTGFFVFEESRNGRPALGAFTDWSALRLWRPRGWQYLPMHGSELFEIAQERNAWTMQINPDGDVGGELYAHEVEMLVNAVRSFRRRRAN